MNALDLIAFRGSDFVSDGIATAEQVVVGSGEFTHVGVLVNTEVMDIKNGLPGRWYVWESTSSLFASDAKDVETGQHRLGVQIRDFEQVKTSYLAGGKAKMAWCRLKQNPSSLVKLDVVRNALVGLHKELFRAGYDFYPCVLFAALLSCMRPLRNWWLTKHQTDFQFCSELAARIYQAVGVLSPELEVNPLDVIPMDFVESYDLDHTVNGKTLFDAAVPIVANQK